jgi:transposase
MDAILFVHLTGCQWNALNQTGICSSSVAHRRFQAWIEAAVFQELWKSDHGEYDALQPAVCGSIRVTPVGQEHLIIEAASCAMQS